MQPVRKIGKSHRAVNGTLVSSRAVGGAQFESTLERDFYTLLEFDPAVESYVTQPLQIMFRTPSGARRRYTPDTLVHYLDGRRPGLFEVKYVEDVRQKRMEMAWRFRAAADHARQQGWTFTLVTEKALRGQFLENARFLLPFARRVVDADRRQVLLGWLLSETTPRALLEGLPTMERGQWLPVLWHLVATRAIGCDLQSPLNMDARIWPAGAP
ncbi:heteromeric transposase endonuclease subunit TnsA [Deinococcus gobiensis]|uniref:Heteromeric transposase endonuclease subunit TnsA n=1 Tax=Deinococcus gobiensis (strain DSM 21396 / JCM 16679 / CGMCC 1.7299 / I-0) TaxID=745776 RepID=H8H2Q8_DEIGI|nr:heteromeric transposase endonuclease subunit TnsA [Deinococcus gobiensis]AFD27805.1 hypothetical protein DGo_PC0013 [Deinococcus gobiensis I-0]